MANGIYSSLDPSRKQIRVLTILPTRHIGDLVRCRLDVQSLEEDAPFNALSYCWGPPNPSSTICVNDVELNVTPNLGHALRHFQATGDWSTTPLWIDALCINQQDTAERNSQVAMMGDIYQRAETVHVWLGGSNLVEQCAMAALRDLAKVDDMYDEKGFEKPWPLENDAAGQRKLAAMASIARNPYWNRTWILQEISFANNVVIHGNKERVLLESHRLGRPLNDLHSRLITTRRKGEVTDLARSIADIFEPILMAGWSAGVKDGIAAGDRSLMRLPQVMFQRFRCALASEPRDKVYGMLSLLPNVFKDIAPDYNKPLREVYQEATIQLMQNANDLEMLSHACSGAADLPSWIPDYRVQTRMPKCVMDYWTTCSAGTLATTAFSATALGELHVRGFRIDSIAHIERGSGPSDLNPFFETRETIVRWRALFDRHVDAQDINNADKEYVFWRATCGGGADGAAFQTEHMEACQQMMAHDGSERPEIEIEDYYGRDFVQYLMEVVQDNNFFITTEGHAGLVPKVGGVGIDDSILIVAGAPTPFCARSIDTHTFSLKAPCFLENNLTGSAWISGAPCRPRYGIMYGGAVLSRANCNPEDQQAIDAIFDDIVIN